MESGAHEKQSQSCHSSQVTVACPISGTQLNHTIGELRGGGLWVSIPAKSQSPDRRNCNCQPKVQFSDQKCDVNCATTTLRQLL